MMRHLFPRLSPTNGLRGDKLKRVAMIGAGYVGLVSGACFNPVAGDTPMLATFMADGDKLNHDSFIASIPLGRACQPADNGAAAAFLCSDDGAFITGVPLEVNGGRGV